MGRPTQSLSIYDIHYFVWIQSLTCGDAPVRPVHLYGQADVAGAKLKVVPLIGAVGAPHAARHVGRLAQPCGDGGGGRGGGGGGAATGGGGSTRSTDEAVQDFVLYWVESGAKATLQ
jgi:hypothetical protein